MLEQRQQAHRIARPERGVQRQPEQAGGRRVGQRRAAGIVGDDTETQKLGANPPRQRAVAGDERRALAGRLDGALQRNRDRHRLVALVGRFHQRHAAQRLLDVCCRKARARLRPKLRGLGRPQRLADKGGAQRKRPCRRADLLDIVARNADAADQLRQAVLRMAKSCRTCARRGYRSEGRIVKLAVEPGQHDGAIGQTGDYAKQFGGRGNGAGRTGGDHRPGRWVALQPRRLPADQRAAVRRRIGAVAFFKQLRPVVGDDAEEIERHLPPAGKVAGDQRRELRPIRALGLDLVHQPGEVARQPDGIGGRGRHHEFLVESRPDMLRQALLPGAHQRRQQQQPFLRGDRRREIDCRCRLGVEGRLIFVEFTERTHRRQDRRAAAEHVDESATQRARRAPRRHVDGRAGQRQRVAIEAEARDQAAIEQRLRQRRQERRSRRDGKDAAQAAHTAFANAPATAASAAGMASGVPTVIQRPLIAMPNRRPAAIALSK